LTRFRLSALALAAAGVLAFASLSVATVDMEKEARKLGFPAKNCLYCHASAHAAEKMKETARELHISEGNCLLCHGANIPAALNDRGEWLVAEKNRLGASRVDMKWLKDYVPPKEESSTPSNPPPKP